MKLRGACPDLPKVRFADGGGQGKAGDLVLPVHAVREPQGADGALNQRKPIGDLAFMSLAKAWYYGEYNIPNWVFPLDTEPYMTGRSYQKTRDHEQMRENARRIGLL